MTNDMESLIILSDRIWSSSRSVALLTVAVIKLSSGNVVMVSDVITGKNLQLATV